MKTPNQIIRETCMEMTSGQTNNPEQLSSQKRKQVTIGAMINWGTYFTENILPKAIDGEDIKIDARIDSNQIGY